MESILYRPAATTLQLQYARAHQERVKRLWFSAKKPNPMDDAPAPPPQPPVRNWLFLASSSRLPATVIIRCVEEVAGLPPGSIVGKARTQRIVPWRFLACYLVREMCPHLSLPQIGRAVGGRDHTSVIHACRKAAMWLEIDPAYVAIAIKVRASIAVAQQQGGGDVG